MGRFVSALFVFFARVYPEALGGFLGAPLVAPVASGGPRGALWDPAVHRLWCPERATAMLCFAGLGALWGPLVHLHGGSCGFLALALVFSWLSLRSARKVNQGVEVGGVFSKH